MYPENHQYQTDYQPIYQENHQKFNQPIHKENHQSGYQGNQPKIDHQPIYHNPPAPLNYQEIHPKNSLEYGSLDHALPLNINKYRIRKYSITGTSCQM